MKRFVPLILICLSLRLGAETIHHWDLREPQWSGQEVKDLTRQQLGKAAASPTFAVGALVIDEQVYIDVPGITASDLPKKSLSVQARVRLSRGQKWGNFIGYMQDNGDYERGWSLGYDESRFLVWLSTGGKMIQVKASEPFTLGEWANVTATFDGAQVRLYVDGKLVGQVAAPGEIAYPDEAFYTIGAYRDSNEHYPMHGQITEATLYGHALTEAEIQLGSKDPSRLTFAVRPAARFLDSRSAEVTWVTSDPDEPAIIKYGPTEELANVATVEINRKALLENLEPQSLYFYRITQGERSSPVYELNNALNFSQPTFEGEGDVESILKGGKGYAVYLGADVEPMLALAGQSEYSIVAFDTDAERVKQARRELYKAKVYGSRVSVTRVDSLQQLLVTSCFADRVICPTWPPDASAAEIARILTPGRGIALIQNAPNDLSSKLAKEELEIGENGDWLVAKRPSTVGAGQWTHQYGDAGSTATSGESLGGARKTKDLTVQWVGRPGADFGIDRQSRMPAPLAANGRLFHQGMNRLAALNASNGAVLWSMEIPDLRRLNMPRDASNWCADDDQLYVAVRERAWILDSESGERLAALPIPGEPSNRDWGYIANVGDRLLGTATKANSAYSGYWTGANWFDGKADSAGTAKVCGDRLFAFSTTSHRPPWTYSCGAILHSTIAARDGRVIFVESRNPKLDLNLTSQISSAELWEDQFLVALDVDTGVKLWERPIDTEDGTITFYLQATADAILITASNTAYHLYTFDPKTGEPIWDHSQPWPNADHSGHIQHPVILNRAIYLQPNGYDLLTGEIITTKMGARSGCHTYIGAQNALIYRGSGRQVAMWDLEAESVSAWNRLRPSCWLSLIPANGMLLAPEGGGGCSCGGWMETSLGFAPLNLLNSGAP